MRQAVLDKHQHRLADLFAHRDDPLHKPLAAQPPSSLFGDNSTVIPYTF